MMLPTMLKEARKFCETTSVRGVPRIIKSQDKGLFIIWLVGVLICAGALIWQITTVFKRYQSYQVNTVFSQAPDSQYPTFPDITVCNSCPLVHETSGNMTYMDFVRILSEGSNYDRVKTFYAEAIGYNISEDEYQQIVQALSVPSIYFYNFPIEDSFRSDIDTTSAPIDCQYFSWDGNTTVACMQTFKPIWDPIYYKCYSFTLPSSERNRVRQFSAIFYVEDFPFNRQSMFYLDGRSSGATGMRVVIHEPGTKPTTQSGFDISPGMETTITLTQTLQTRLSRPYSNCTTQKTLAIKDETATYSSEYCLDVCNQDVFLLKCGCLRGELRMSDQQMALLMDDNQVNYTICTNLSMARKDYLDWRAYARFSCIAKLNIASNSCSSMQCPTPCVEYQHAASSGSAPWPHISSQLSFYKAYIENKPRYDGMFDAFKTIDDNALEENKTTIEMLRKLDDNGLIRKRFLQINVRFDSAQVNLMTDVAAFTLDAMGAQIGGVLSLWLGITIIVVMEIVEFIYTVIVAGQGGANKTSASSDTLATIITVGRGVAAAK